MAFGLLTSAHAAKLHLVAVSDSGDEGIGVDVAVDLVNILALADRIAKDTDMTLSATVVTSSKIPNAATKSGGPKHAAYKAFSGKFSKLKQINFKHTKTMDTKTVRNALKGVSAGSDDVILFHYAGHGFRWSDQGAQWPALDLGGWVKAVNNDESAADVKAAATKSIQMQEVMDTLGKKGARLTIAMSDSCKENNDIAMPKGSKAKGRGKSKLADGFVKLFRKAKGHIHISSTKPNELAWGNPEVGGVFTYLFIDSVIKQANKGDKAEWAKVLKPFKSAISMSLGDGEMSEDQHPRVDEKISYGAVGAGGGKASGGGAKPAAAAAVATAATKPARQLRRPGAVKPVRAALRKGPKGNKVTACSRAAVSRCKMAMKKKRFKNKAASRKFMAACVKRSNARCKAGNAQAATGKAGASCVKQKRSSCMKSALRTKKKRSPMELKKIGARCAKLAKSTCKKGAKKIRKLKKKRVKKKLLKRKKK